MKKSSQSFAHGMSRAHLGEVTATLVRQSIPPLGLLSSEGLQAVVRRSNMQARVLNFLIIPHDHRGPGYKKLRWLSEVDFASHSDSEQISDFFEGREFEPSDDLRNQFKEIQHSRDPFRPQGFQVVCYEALVPMTFLEASWIHFGLDYEPVWPMEKVAEDEKAFMEKQVLHAMASSSDGSDCTMFGFTELKTLLVANSTGAYSPEYSTEVTRQGFHPYAEHVFCCGNRIFNKVVSAKRTKVNAPQPFIKWKMDMVNFDKSREYNRGTRFFFLEKAGH